MPSISLTNIIIYRTCRFPKRVIHVMSTQVSMKVSVKVSGEVSNRDECSAVQFSALLKYLKKIDHLNGIKNTTNIFHKGILNSLNVFVWYVALYPAPNQKAESHCVLLYYCCSVLRHKVVYTNIPQQQNLIIVHVIVLHI